MKLRARVRGGGPLLLALALAACGDPHTADSRGYTKAPLEHPTVLIRGEEPGEVARYGGPNRVVAEVIELPEQQQQQRQPDQQRAAVDLPEGVTEEMVTQGEQLFASTGNCFTCHGTGGSGSPIGPTLDDPEWIHIDGAYDEIVAIIESGVPNPQQFPAAMPARGGAALNEEQVRQIAAYVFSISR